MLCATMAVLAAGQIAYAEEGVTVEGVALSILETACVKHAGRAEEIAAAASGPAWRAIDAVEYQTLTGGQAPPSQAWLRRVGAGQVILSVTPTPETLLCAVDIVGASAAGLNRELPARGYRGGTVGAAATGVIFDLPDSLALKPPVDIAARAKALVRQSLDIDGVDQATATLLFGLIDNGGGVLVFQRPAVGSFSLQFLPSPISTL